MQNKIAIKDDVVKLIASAAVETGITLIGGISGVGKTETAQTVIDHIKDSGLLPHGNVLYINTFSEKEAGHDIYDIASSFLASLSDDSPALIVLDELYYQDSVDLALMLSQSGKSVLGVVQAYPAPSSPSGTEVNMSSVLHHAVMRGQVDSNPIRVHALLNELNLLVMQDSLAPTHHRALKLDSSTKDTMLSTIIPDDQPLAGYDVMQMAVSQDSVDALYNAIDALPIDRR